MFYFDLRETTTGRGCNPTKSSKLVIKQYYLVELCKLNLEDAYYLYQTNHLPLSLFFPLIKP